jgi:hypothetical protein
MMRARAASPAPGRARLERQERLQLWGEVYGPALSILGRAGVEPERTDFSIQLTPLENQNLALRAPAEGVLQRDGNPRIEPKVTPHTPVLGVFENP